MKIATLILTLTLTLALTLNAQTFESFQRAGAWIAAPASGVEMHLAIDSGHTGKGLRIDFDFHGGGGWAALRREVPLRLPDNYEFTFWLKGAAPRNTLEFKLIDATGENVWWVNRPEFEFTGGWRKITLRKRHFSFAWGPRGGGDIREVAAIEFAITAGSGGKGTIWLDELALVPLEPVRAYHATPVITTTSNARTIDFTRNREFGGIIVDWNAPAPSRAYDVQISMDGETWQTARTVRGGMRVRDYLQLPETEARYLRLLLHAGATPQEIADVRVQPLAWGASRNALFETIAADAPRGSYPKYFSNVQSYWTVVGLPRAATEALINEEGAVEVGKRLFSLEPFIFTDGGLSTWADAHSAHTLQQGTTGLVPVPSATRTAGDLELQTTVWAAPAARNKESLTSFVVRYSVQNRGTVARALTLYVAARPFQVNPSSQFLNTAGGATTIHSIDAPAAGVIRIDDTKQLMAHEPLPAGFGATRFDQGDIVDFLRHGALPPARQVSDAVGLASAALAYPLLLGPGEARNIEITVADTGALPVAKDLASAVAKWDEELSTFQVSLPDARIAASLRSNLGYILINADKAAIQPGSRSYERSWIRDGSLTSAALLRLGHAADVKRFIEWYAPFQYADGKVPCCVDQRGADPVPENDSHGQLSYLITEYFRYTNDTAFVRRMYPHVGRAVAYIDSLRNSRRTQQYRGSAFWGMLPQSISHEGYSAKPMHSYWDDFFALKGLKDAAWLAQALGDSAHAPTWRALRDAFQSDLVRSFEIAMQQHHIDWLPGSVELGDFDAPSTTVGVNPAAAQRDLPQAALQRTFDKYWEQFVARRDSGNWQAYTPYEWRVVGSFVRLGERRRAHVLLDWFMQHQRPAGWHHWAEVVYRDAAAPHFIGDMPHTWVGSDFIRAVLDMFVYDADDALVIAAGIIPEWLDGAAGVSVMDIRTPYGAIGYSVARRGPNVSFTFRETPHAPLNGFIIRSPLDQPIRSARADGRIIEAHDNEVHVATLPRELMLSY